MSRLLATLAMFALLIGLGTLAVAARTGSAAPDATQPETQPQISVAAAPEANTLSVSSAPAATLKYTAISIPLSVTQQFLSMGLTTDAKGLASFIGKAGVQELRQWNPSAANWEKWYPNVGAGFGTNFALQTNGVYFIQANSSLTQTTLSFVGGVPESGTVHYGLVGAPSCKWNSITLPLDQSAITTAALLAEALGKTNVNEVRQWNATIQNWEKWYPNVGAGFGTNFATQIGYPYWVCMKASQAWP